jgi:hypothetical protein
VTDSSDVIGVLLALYLLTDADIHDSVPEHQLRIDANRPQADVDQAFATLVKRGLAETVFISEDTSWVGITDEGVRFIAQLAGRAKQSVN